MKSYSCPTCSKPLTQIQYKRALEILKAIQRTQMRLEPKLSRKIKKGGRTERRSGAVTQLAAKPSRLSERIARAKGSISGVKARFEMFIYDDDNDTDCWFWEGAKNSSGYGEFRLDTGSPVYAHQLAYVLYKKDLPDDLTIDHLCRNRTCVNPSHLQPVTMRRNAIRRGEALRKLIE
jgi:hypothetical protein